MSKHGHQNIQFEILSSELIKHVLGFENDDENFGRSLSYVLSNLLYHHCLDANNHSIERSLIGICQKMVVHGHSEKKEMLSSLVKRFFNLPILNDMGDLKWLILSVLLRLSRNPTSDELYSNLVESFTTSPQDDESFLDVISDLQLEFLPDLDGNETLSDWTDEDDEEEVISDIEKSVSNDVDGNKNIVSICTKLQNSSFTKDFKLTEEWLTCNLQECYWRNDLKGKGSPMSEYSLIRETLWLLICPRPGYLYIEKDGLFTLQDDVIFGTLSKKASSNLLEPICLAASQLKEMDSWLRHICTIKVEDAGSSNLVCNTAGLLIVYAQSLREWRNKFSKKVVEIEESVVKQKMTLTIYSVVSSLDSYLRTISALYTIYSSSLCLIDDEWKSLRLINNLFEISSSSCDPILRSALDFIIIDILNYLADTFAQLLNDSHLMNSSLREFGLQHLPNLKGDELQICSYQISETYPTDLRGIKFLTSIHKPLIDICSMTEMFKALDSTPYHDHVDIQSIIFGCLDIEEASTGNVSSVLEIDDSVSSNSLSFDSIICCDDPILRMAFRHQSFYRQKDSKKYIKKHRTEPLSIDSLLINSLRPIFEERVYQMGMHLKSFILLDLKLEVNLSAFVDVMLVETGDFMQMFLLNLFSKIDSKEKVSSIDLTLHLRYCISQVWLSCADNFSVNLDEFEANIKDEKNSFNSDVLSSILINCRVPWPMSLVLNKSNLLLYNKLFQFCLSLKRGMIVLERLNFKEIGHYESCYSIDSIPGPDLISELDGSRDVSLPYLIHRLHLLRQWLLHLARLLHDHFTTSLLHPFVMNIRELIKKSMTFEEFVNAHNESLIGLCYQCLLMGGKSSPIQIALSKVFSSIEKLSEIWRGPPSNIQIVNIEELEEQFSSCHRFLARFLSSLQQTDFYPHVETLAQALVHSCPV